MNWFGHWLNRAGKNMVRIENKIKEGIDRAKIDTDNIFFDKAGRITKENLKRVREGRRKFKKEIEQAISLDEKKRVQNLYFRLKNIEKKLKDKMTFKQIKDVIKQEKEKLEKEKKITTLEKEVAEKRIAKENLTEPIKQNNIIFIISGVILFIIILLIFKKK